MKKWGKVSSVEKVIRNLLIYKLLLEIIEVGEKKNFGSISKVIHDKMARDPRPYRKEIKERQANLFSLLEKYAYDQFKIETANRSQLITRLK